MDKTNKKSNDLILHIAELANLKPKNDDVKILNSQVESTIEYISKLQEIDTNDIKPTLQVTGLINVYREDIVDKDRMLTQDEALSNAKRKFKGFFVVNAILDR